MNDPKKKTAIIIGAGPAGLTAAYELIDKTDIKPIIYEMSGYIGGISKTLEYKGNRIDMGGHRFFSKSDLIMQWWQKIMPLQGAPSKDEILLNKRTASPLRPDGPDPEKTDNVMLIRRRLSRIFYQRKFFDYPINLNLGTFSNLGLNRIIKISMSYAKIRTSPIRNEKSLEDFFINRFGKSLYLMFFKDYSEKIWGIPCDNIKPEWGAQRIKGLSINKVITHALKHAVSRNNDVVSQKNTETSLIGKFMYPKLGPGQFWEEVARIIKKRGGEINVRHQAVGFEHQGDRINGVYIKNGVNGEISRIEGEYVFSTIPVKDLIVSFRREVSREAKEAAEGLKYRDLITIGVILKKLKIINNTKIRTVNNVIPDNWIYIQEKDVKVGRIQIFNNWSPYLVKDSDSVWIGLEYFCNEDDQLWRKTDTELNDVAADELIKLGFIDKRDILDSIVIRIPKAYPIYCGSYGKFEVIKDFTDQFKNLFLIGRNGMHRYNNMDHSMLTAIVAVENIIKGNRDKSIIWNVNTESAYCE